MRRRSSRDVEQVHDDLETLRFHTGRERTIHVVEVVDGSEVDAHGKSLIDQKCA
jgi:hypothetical protein